MGKNNQEVKGLIQKLKKAMEKNNINEIKEIANKLMFITR